MGRMRCNQNIFLVKFWGSFIDKKISQRARMTKEIEGILNNLGSSIDISRASILSEASNEDGIVEIDLEELGDSNKNE